MLIDFRRHVFGSHRLPAGARSLERDVTQPHLFSRLWVATGTRSVAAGFVAHGSKKPARSPEAIIRVNAANWGSDSLCNDNGGYRNLCEAAVVLCRTHPSMTIE